MSPEEAAREFWATIDAVQEHRPIANRHEKACRVLKEHMTDRSLTRYRGIELVETDGGQRLDQGKAQAKLGARLADCFVPDAPARPRSRGEGGSESLASGPQ